MKEWTLKREVEKYQITTPKITKSTSREEVIPTCITGSKESSEGMDINTKDLIMWRTLKYHMFIACKNLFSISNINFRFYTHLQYSRLLGPCRAWGQILHLKASYDCIFKQYQTGMPHLFFILFFTYKKDIWHNQLAEYSCESKDYLPVQKDYWGQKSNIRVVIYHVSSQPTVSPASLPHTYSCPVILTKEWKA